MNRTHSTVDPKYVEVMQKLSPEERLALSGFYSTDFRIRTQEVFAKHFGELGLQRWLEIFYDEKIARGVLGNQYQES